MTSNSIGIQVNNRHASSSGSRLTAFAVGTVLAFALYLSVMWVIHSSLSIGSFGVGFWIYPVVGIVTIAAFSLLHSFKGKTLALAAAAVFVIAALILRKGFIHGLNIYADQIAIIRTQLTGLIQSRFDRGNDEYTSALVFSIFLSFAVAALSVIVASEGRKWTVFIFPMLMIPGLLLGIIKPGLPFAAALTVIIVTAIGKFLGYNDALVRTKGTVVPILATSVILLLTLAVLAFSGPPEASSGGSLKEIYKDKIHSLKYEKQANPMPEGELINIGEFRPTGRVSLRVIMTKPEPTYLRGFVGEKYADGKWTSLSGSFYTENSNTFYWLHEDGFYGQSQRSTAYSLTADVSAEKMRVMNVSACGRYLYAPYGLYQAENAVSDKRSIGDATILSNKKNADVTFDYVPDTVHQSYVIQQDLALDSGKEGVAEYMEDEKLYRDLVYKYYLSIPDEVKEVLEQCLGPRKELSSSLAKIAILEYLDANVRYREDINSNRSEEIVGWFLTQRKAGYSVHYAAAAAMMLRYYGIPARYVEGFVITPDAAAGIKESEPFDVTEQMSHAWAEYYLDGVGWIPFEAAPKYRDPNMYLAAGELLIQDDENKEGKGSSAFDGEDDEQDKPVNDEDRFDNPINNWRRIFAFRKVWAIALACLVLLVLLAVVFVRRRRLSRFIKTFENSEPRRGIINAFAYAGLLISKKIPEADRNRLGDFSEMIGETFGCGRVFGKAKALADKAMYSSKPLEAEDRNTVIEVKDCILNAYKKDRSMLQKLYDRFILCIY